MKQIIILCSILIMAGCSGLKLDINDAYLACSGSELDEYVYRDKRVNITVRCKSRGEE